MFAYVSIFLCLVQKRGKIGQCQENSDQSNFGALSPSKHDNFDRAYQLALH